MPILCNIVSNRHVRVSMILWHEHNKRTFTDVCLQVIFLCFYFDSLYFLKTNDKSVSSSEQPEFSLMTSFETAGFLSHRNLRKYITIATSILTLNQLIENSNNDASNKNKKIKYLVCKVLNLIYLIYYIDSSVHLFI